MIRNSHQITIEELIPFIVSNAVMMASSSGQYGNKRLDYRYDYEKQIMLYSVIIRRKGEDPFVSREEYENLSSAIEVYNNFNEA